LDSRTKPRDSKGRLYIEANLDKVSIYDFDESINDLELQKK